MTGIEISFGKKKKKLSELKFALLKERESWCRSHAHTCELWSSFHWTDEYVFTFFFSKIVPKINSNYNGH